MFTRYRNGILAGLAMVCALLTACGDSSTKPATLTATTSSLAAGTVGTAYSTSLSASGGTTPYTWAETSGGNLPAGLSLANAGTISGTPTTSGTFGPYVFSVTDAKGATASTTGVSMTISAVAVAACVSQGNEAALTASTPYGFLLKGADANGNPLDIAGSFTPNGTGGITAASIDYNGFSNGYAQFVVDTANSSYSFGSATQGCLYLSISAQAANRTEARSASTPVHVNATHSRKLRTANSRIGSVGSARPQASSQASSVKFQFTLASQTGRIIESDSATDAAGFIYRQTPGSFALSSLQANYAFGTDGWYTPDGTHLARAALAGAFTNSSGTLSLGFADYDNNGNASGVLTGGSGTINTTVDAATGRATGNYTTTTKNGPLTFDFVIYILNGSDLILMSTNSPNTGTPVPMLAGRVLASSATYDPHSLLGYYMYASEGYDPAANAGGGGNFVQIGTLGATNAGGIPTATIYNNDAGTASQNTYTNGTYIVDTSSGRVTATGIGGTPPVAYLVASGSDDGIAAFTVGTDAASSSGVLVSQSDITPAYTAALLNGQYGGSTDEDVDGSNGAWIGTLAFSGAGAYTLSSPLTIGTVGVTPLSSGVYTINPDGSGTLDTNFTFVTNGTRVYAIPNSGDPLLFVLELATD